jgi:hypothetical protein
MQTHESWYGNLTALGFVSSMWTHVDVDSLQGVLTIVATITTICWTVEKWRVERVRRRGYEQSIGMARSSKLSSLWAAMKSKPAELDTDQAADWQDHHKGK